MAADPPKVELCRCYVNPLKKLPVCTGGEPLALSANVATLMLYYKLVDNIADSKGIKKLGWKLLLPFVQNAQKHAALNAPKCDEIMAAFMQEQKEIERQLSKSVDIAAQPTAAALGAIFGLLSDNPSTQRVLERLGYLTGRYVYLIDALDDIESDIKTGNYNPFILRHNIGRNPQPHLLNEAFSQAKESLNLTIGEAEKTLALLEMRDFGPIITNIVTMGLRASMDEIMSKKEKNR